MRFFATYLEQPTALSKWGKVIIAIATALSTGLAIDATLFATARLAKKLADKGSPYQ